MAPLLLLSIAVLSAGFERLIFWLNWRREQPGCLDGLRSSTSGLSSVEASRVVEQRLRRLDRQFSRWEPSLDLAMVALLVQRINRMQRRSVVAQLREACLEV